MSEPWTLSAVEIADRVRAGSASAVDVTRGALDRLAAVNPAINAVVAEMPDEALEAAGAIDAAVASGDDPGPLAGVPITIKVNADQVGHATTNGLTLQRDLIAQSDNPVVSNLRQAGAVIIGRTNTPAFSMRWFARNRVHGHTLNPRTPAITPGGSSGGAAAAVAAGIGAIAHGTDIAGSVRYPAYACGVHGLRPTPGRIPAWNPSGPDRQIGAQLTSVAGPIARTVADVRAGFAAMAAGHLDDPWWVPVPLEMPLGAKRAALAVSPDGLAVTAGVEAALRDAAARLEAEGWAVIETDCPPLREPADLQMRLWLAEMRHGAPGAVEREGDPDACFVYECMQARCPEPGLEGMLDAFKARVGLARQWQHFLDEYPVLLCPVSAEPPFPDLLDVESATAFDRVIEAQLPQIALPFVGMPCMTVSTGLDGEVPIGVQLVAGRFHEARLLRAAEAIERGGVPVSPVDPRPAAR